MALDHTANLLGALAVAITDRTSDAVVEEAGVSGSAAAAMSAMLFFLEAPSVDLLRQVLGLTSSGTVRLVDGLEQAGQVRRGPGDDRRSTSLKLTGRGRRAAQRVAAARARVLQDVVGRLTADERRALDALISKLLAGMIRAPGAVRWTCRLCDTDACGRSRGRCPLANEAEARYGGKVAR